MGSGAGGAPREALVSGGVEDADPPPHASENMPRYAALSAFIQSLANSGVSRRCNSSGEKITESSTTIVLSASAYRVLATSVILPV